MTIRKIGCLFAIHPMFRKKGMVEHYNGANKYKVAAYTVVPEEVVVNSLFNKLSQGKHIMYSFRKYPEFIRNRVNRLLDRHHQKSLSPQKQ
tara:strand:- start:446 stop:718 length:273 start_codon:yes stop_codon:yes gene_type:complete